MMQKEYWIVNSGGGYPIEAYFTLETALQAQKFHKSEIIHVALLDVIPYKEEAEE